MLPTARAKRADLAKRVARSSPVIAMAFFTDDDYDVGGRGAEAKSQLASREAPSLVIDTPAGFDGHGAGNFAPFNDKYGSCLFDLADAAKKSAPCF